MPGNTLYIVVPCYNEEEVLPETARRLGDKLRALISAGKSVPKAAFCLSTTAPKTEPGR